MGNLIRIEIVGRDEFWRKAVTVEWKHQFPDRAMVASPDGVYLIEAAWLKDLERVAAQCFSSVLQAPDDPGRRQWLRCLVGRRNRE